MEKFELYNEEGRVADKEIAHKMADTEKLFRERIVKVCIHELGHNLGLPHCKADDKCLMNDANGTISQVDKECMYFCDSCKKKIRN